MFTVFANFFLASMIKNKLLQVPRISLPLIKNDKTSQEVDQKWTYLLMLNPCVYVCVKLVYDSCQRECHNMLTHLSISLFFVLESFGTIIQKLLKRRENYNKKPIYGTENMVLNKYFLKKFQKSKKDIFCLKSFWLS